MADILTLRPSEHEAVRELLPWHVTGTLSSDETARVEAHLEQCADCRADLAAERELAREVALLPLDVEEGWNAMALRMGGAGGNDNARVPLLLRRIPAGWAFGGAIAATVALTLAMTGLQRPAAPNQTFHTLGSPAAAGSGQAIVLFRPDTTEEQMRAVLTAQGVRVVDGPTAAGAFVLRVEGRSATDAINGLRQSSQVVLAEPITSDGRP